MPEAGLPEVTVTELPLTEADTGKDDETLGFLDVDVPVLDGRIPDDDVTAETLELCVGRLLEAEEPPVGMGVDEESRELENPV